MRDGLTAEGREPNRQIAPREAVQVPHTPTRNSLGFGSNEYCELALETQARVLPNHTVTDRVGDLVAAKPEDVQARTGREQEPLRADLDANARRVVHRDGIRNELAVIG